MNILLTNDDGIYAQGINALFQVLGKKHNVFIIAPAEEKSGSSSAITIKENIKIKILSENKYALYGYTADCVNVGLNGNLIPKVDLVISGINHGQNIGDDIYFSGTVAGARLAYLYGISGIAISLNSRGESDYFYDTSEFLIDFIENSNMFIRNKSLFLNINYPNLPKNKILGVKYSSMSKNKNNDLYQIISRENGEINLRYTRSAEPAEIEESDITEGKKGYITITPLLPEDTDYRLLSDFTKVSVQPLVLWKSRSC